MWKQKIGKMIAQEAPSFHSRPRYKCLATNKMRRPKNDPVKIKIIVAKKIIALETSIVKRRQKIICSEGLIVKLSIPEKIIAAKKSLH